MNLDTIFFLLLAVFGLLGFMTGFWSQIIKLFALLGAYLLARSLAGPLDAWLGLGLQSSPVLGRVAGLMLSFVVLYIGFSFLGWAIVRAWRSSTDRSHGFTDRISGAALGSTKAFVIMYLLLCFIVLVEEPLSKHLPGGRNFTENSFMLDIARKHNLLAGLHISAVEKTVMLARVAADPALMDKAARDPNVQKLLQHPKVHALLNDRALISACEQKRFGELLSNPRLNEVLEDPEVMRLLDSIELDESSSNNSSL